MKRSVISLIGFFSVGAVVAQQQTSRCAQTLRLAQSTYEQGRLHEVPTLLEGCINGVEFSVVEKTNALRLVVLSHLYLEESDKADEAMLEILRNEHFYVPNEAVDPPEYVALYRTFRTEAIWSMGGLIGGNATLPMLLNTYSVGGAAAGQGSYSPGITLQGGFYFEKRLFGDFTGAPELLYVSHKYTYSNSGLNISDETGESIQGLSSVLTQQEFDLNLLMQYRLSAGNWNPYVTLGPAFNYILKVKDASEGDFSTTGNAVSGADIDQTDSYKPLNYSIIIGAGVKRRIGGIYILGSIRYKYGLTNAIDPQNRTNNDAAFDYNGTANDFLIHSVMLNLGIMIPKFNPQKLKIK